jgi:hypothetical protein
MSDKTITDAKIVQIGITADPHKRASLPVQVAQKFGKEKHVHGALKCAAIANIPQEQPTSVYPLIKLIEKHGIFLLSPQYMEDDRFVADLSPDVWGCVAPGCEKYNKLKPNEIVWIRYVVNVGGLTATLHLAHCGRAECEAKLQLATEPMLGRGQRTETTDPSASAAAATTTATTTPAPPGKAFIVLDMEGLPKLYVAAEKQVADRFQKERKIAVILQREGTRAMVKETKHPLYNLLKLANTHGLLIPDDALTDRREFFHTVPESFRGCINTNCIYKNSVPLEKVEWAKHLFDASACEIVICYLYCGNPVCGEVATKLSASKFTEDNEVMAVHTTQCEQCGVSGTGLNQMMVCGGCHVPHYCSRECQRTAWPLHKLQCNK